MEVELKDEERLEEEYPDEDLREYRGEDLLEEEERGKFRLYPHNISIKEVK